MPQESAGRTRRPALVLLVGLVLTLVAHLVACGVHAGEDHGSVASAASPAHGEHGAGALAAVVAGSACSVTGDDGHSGNHDVLCCDQAAVPAYLSAAAGTALLAFLLLVLLPLGRRAIDLAASGAPPGRGEASRASGFTGPVLLQLVCVSRT